MAWLTPDEHQQQVEAARDLVLRRLDRSAAPRAALAQLLERKGTDLRVAEEVLDRLEAAGVVDDAAYAATLVRTRFAEKGAARRAIAQELRRKGVGEQDLAAALEQIDADDERSAALSLAARRLALTRSLAPEVRRRRVLAHLARKGYSMEVCAHALERALAQEAADATA
ncbi:MULTISPECIES: regulatory protein RecX [unclassified Actinomyces]|uniref:regulatory protein RecX n=1 Tax=unclassified Actinomyces TaxID=2609248 RepID=UPI002017A179|nr:MULTISPECIES: regulatory protein RecX [unclassified Actinomyces]MCL3776727.1 RecX family transcriptional regulator [Actinomyces sp. AC-20-1]MCL3790422.1 RecX family transcriptional regulator [Actinomyces sp. 187325]MCL3792041.1 RecX family transcriptional regulator [Actinomyces sp. 186855]MCL3795043.1 RecX family transcriptional regulator [Actinomyces sp. 217892]